MTEWHREGQRNSAISHGEETFALVSAYGAHTGVITFNQQAV